MPELPEVETVRRGLVGHTVGRRIVRARTLHPRVARRHLAGAVDLCDRLAGRRISSVERRGKYLWFPLEPSPLEPGPLESGQPGDGAPTEALLAHLGMSGQFRVTSAPLLEHSHRRFDAELDDGNWLTFLDQRTFGGVGYDELVSDASETRTVPAGWRHVAADPFEAAFDRATVTSTIRRKQSEIKRVLLDQTVVSGIGNIYADEALWRARLHPARVAAGVRPAGVRHLLDAASEVMTDALGEGGTSFDALYVNVNGESGYFERSLAVYGREDEPCRRCGAPIRRLAFTNRSSYVCLRCQRPPRSGRSSE